MKRMKTFFKYFLIVFVFYFVSDIVAAQMMLSTYYNKDVEIAENSPKVEISASEATITNGYVYGTITNDSDETIENKYLKLTFYSKNGTEMGKKYVKIDKLAPGESMDFKVRYNFDNVKKAVASFVLGTSDEIKHALKNFPENFRFDDLELNDTDKFILFFAVITVLGY